MGENKDKNTLQKENMTKLSAPGPKPPKKGGLLANIQLILLAAIVLVIGFSALRLYLWDKGGERIKIGYQDSGWIGSDLDGTGWANKDSVLVNLPDVIPSIAYDRDSGQMRQGCYVPQPPAEESLLPTCPTDSGSARLYAGGRPRLLPRAQGRAPFPRQRRLPGSRRWLCCIITRSNI